MVTAVGSYEVKASVTPPSPWIIQMIAFRDVNHPPVLTSPGAQVSSLNGVVSLAKPPAGVNSNVAPSAVLVIVEHSPGSITFFNKADKFMISGDVLFYACIGRTDLPMGNYETLITSIKQKLLPLGDDMTVYSGHGQETTIGSERMYNTFLV